MHIDCYLQLSQSVSMRAMDVVGAARVFLLVSLPKVHPSRLARSLRLWPVSRPVVREVKGVHSLGKASNRLVISRNCFSLKTGLLVK